MQQQPPLITHKCAPATTFEAGEKVCRRFPAFAEALNTYFPNALPLREYMDGVAQALKPYGFVNENTMGMVASCRDELADPLFEAVIEYWGKTFNCCSLAGFITLGRTGLAAAIAHTPIENGVRRFAFFAMPHIALSRHGQPGFIFRQGIKEPSHACGALDQIVHELENGHINVQIDMQDLEQSIVRQKILSTLRYGDRPDLVGMTRLASKIISQDVRGLLSGLNTQTYSYATITAIQIHGPDDTQWVYPNECYVTHNSFPAHCVSIPEFTNLSDR